MTGVNKPTTLREVIKEEVEEIVQLPNHLLVTGSSLLTMVIPSTSPTPGNRVLALVRQVGLCRLGRDSYQLVIRDPSIPLRSVDCLGLQGLGNYYKSVPLRDVTGSPLKKEFCVNSSHLAGQQCLPTYQEC
ncbi:hypothetical protein E2C01_048572 [Portunus trituberculatus]|uniref:Uncharacterized protein n=1 Tax=Portunus trituberculatus TaxID=210409 RepID=A0A5B7GAK6_PORTR|nr:hypothetical protein [Portunus trituberculatus]